MNHPNLMIKRAVLFTAALCMAASASFGAVELPAAARDGLQRLHPGAKIMSVSQDEDGLYHVDLNVKQERFAVELTRSGRVITNTSRGKIDTRASGGPKLPEAVAAVVQKLYPHGKLVSARADDDGIYHVRVATAQGVSTLEATRSGRILRHDRDAADSDEDFSTGGSTVARHIESVRKLPAPVLAAVEQAHPRGVIVHVYQDHYGPRYGRSAYYVSIVRGQNVYNVGLSAEGKILKNQIDNQTERLNRLPQSIKDAAYRALPGGLIYGSGTRNGLHQIDVLVDGKPFDLEITKTGEVVSKKRDYHE